MVVFEVSTVPLSDPHSCGHLAINLAIDEVMRDDTEHAVIKYVNLSVSNVILVLISSVAAGDSVPL